MSNAIYIDETQAKATQENSDTSTWLQTVMKNIQAFATVSRVLRLLGAFIVMGSMSTFLLQEWSSVSDLNRFYLLLGQTGLFAVIGLGLSFLLKENKGGRIFFTLALLSITANVTTLGALIFSVIQWGGGLSAYPDFATWSIGNVGDLLLAFACIAVVSIPVISFAYSVMARQAAKPLVALFIASNSLLLIPVRDSFSVAIIVIAASLALLFVLRKVISHNMVFRTLEGRIAIATVLLPLVIMMVRSFWLYQADEFLYLTLSVLAFVAIRFTAKSINDDNSAFKRTLDWFSLFNAAAIAIPVTALLDHWLPEMAVLSTLSTIFAGIVCYVAHQAGRNKRTFVTIAGLALVLAHLLQLVAFGGATALFAMIAGGVTMALAKLATRRYLFVIGALTSLIGLVYNALSWFEGLNFSSWVAMTLLGVATIIAASILERYGALIKLKWSKWGETE